MSGNASVEDKKVNPGTSYMNPDDVLADQKLTREEKIAILREWHYDATRMQESDNENMTGGEPDRLRAVSKALLQLGVSPAAEADPHAPAPSTAFGRLGNYISGALRGLRLSKDTDTSPRP